MQQHEFNLFAKKIKQEGKLTTKQALDKFLKALMAGPKLKVVKKQTIRSYENGIKTFPDGRERCMTKEAKMKRAVEVWERDEGICQFRLDQYVICWRPVLCAWANLHHRVKRSVGRDDRAANLCLMCPEHHIFFEHDEFKKRGAHV